MKGILLTKPFEISVSELPEAILPTDGEPMVLVRTLTAGICGSDISAYRGTSPLVSYPRIIGHEATGIIEEAAPETGFKKGDFVAVEPYINCGDCYPCSKGRTNCCNNIKVIGVHADGSMREVFAHPARLIHKLPEDIDPVKAACIEPLTIALNAVHRLKLTEGEKVVVFGAGTIGHLIAKAALTVGAVPLVADMVQERLDLLEKEGIATVNTKEDDLLAVVEKFTDGRMAECAAEATGAEPCIRAALDCVAHTGRVALTGWPHGEISLNTALITRKDLDIVGSRNSCGEFPLATQLIYEGKVNVDAIITKVVPFEGLAQAVIDQSEHPGEFLKIVGDARL